METEKRLFAKIPKNDYGQVESEFLLGGVLPKGSKRNMMMLNNKRIDHRYLEFGFYIGDHGDETRERFLHNCEKHGSVLQQWLVPRLSAEKFVFGRSIVSPDGDIDRVQEFQMAGVVQNPKQANIEASIIWTKDKLMSLPRDLQQKILRWLFPLN